MIARSCKPRTRKGQLDLGARPARRRLALAVACLVAAPFAPRALAAIGAGQFVEAMPDGVPAIDSPGETWGAAWGDYDGDGDPDLWLGMHEFQPTALFRNNGNGTFTDTIDSAVLAAADHYSDDTHGAAWADFDNDGDQDLIEVCGAGAGSGAGAPEIAEEWRNNLFVNEGAILNEAAQAWGVDHPRARSRTPLWIDYDSDGDLDLVVSALATSPEHYPSAIFRQDPGGFADAAAQTGFAAGSCQYAMQAHLGPSGEQALICGDTSRISAIYDVTSLPFQDLRPVLGSSLYNAFPFDLAVGDFDGDLIPDVFAGITPPNPSSAVRTGPGHDRIHAYLSPAAAEKGLSFTAPGDVQIEFGWDTLRGDIHLGANGVAPPANSDNGLLGPDRYPHRVSFSLSASNPSHQGLPASRSAGIYLGRVAGRWEIRVVGADHEVNLTARASGISAPAAIGSVSLTQGNASVPQLYLNQGGALVLQTTASAFPGVPTASIQTYARSLAAGDFDNDMDLDLYIGSSGRVANVSNLLLDNQGNGTFAPVANAGGAAGGLLGSTDTATLVDYDQNGFLDLFVTQGNAPAPFSYGGQQQLFRNQGNANHWILVDLEGTISNRDGIGAVVYASTPDGKVQMREQGGGVHRYAQDYRQVHFGLAGNATVDLEVLWPSGQLDTFSGLAANQVYRLVEGGGGGTGHQLGAADVQVGESAGSAQVSVTLSPAPGPGEQVQVSWQSANGTALAGSDYTAASGILTYTAGQTAKTVSVPILNDGVGEPTESFGLTFAGAGTGGAAATVTIQDDDGGGQLPQCGQPSYNRASESALFVWNDCGTGQWHLRATAGGQSLTYRGGLTPDQPFASLSAFSFESGDLLPPPDFTMIVSGSGQDGIDFALAQGSGACLDLSAPGSAPILAGVNRIPVAGPVALPGFGPCGGGGSLPACGTPSYNRATEAGVFLWNDCGTDQWHLRATAGGQNLVYRGSLTSSPPLTGVTAVSFESGDLLPPSFVMTVGGSGQDGFDFSFAPGTEPCLDLTAPAGAVLRAGSDRVLVSDPVGLPGFGPCTP
jgi:hypothetical protein